MGRISGVFSQRASVGTGTRAFGLNWNQKKKHTISFSSSFSSSSAPFHESPLINSMNLKIKEQLNAQSVTISDAYGDGRHVSISVVSEAFEGKSAVNRQRMVYKAIWEELQTTVHAVDHMSTKTPQEASSASDD